MIFVVAAVLFSEFVKYESSNVEIKADVAKEDRKFYYKLHGYLMIISWLVLVPLTILIARFGKDKIGKNWYHIHRVLNYLVFLGTTASLVIVCIVKKNVVFKAKNFFHPLVGSIIYGLMVIQIGFGIYINRKFNPNREAVPWHDKFHIVLGYFLVVLGLIDTLLVFTFKSKIPWYVYYGLIYFGGSIFVFIILQLKYGTTKHINNTRTFEDESNK